jgi:uncharacterized protein (DUF1015 family)
VKFFSFRSVIPKQEVAHRVTSLGSGKLPLKWLQNKAQEEPLSYMRIVKPQYLDSSLEQGSDEFYQACAANFNALMQAEAMIELPEGLCYYKQIKPDGEHYEGWIVGVTAEGYRNGRIVRHENTIKSKENRLVRYLQTLNSVAEPVLLTQSLPARVVELGKTMLHSSPDLDYEDAQGLRHQLYALPCQDTRCGEVLELLQGLQKIYIADGHHRVAACSTYLEGQSDTGFMALLLDGQELAIKSFHRIFSDPNWNMGLNDLTQALVKAGLTVQPCGEEDDVLRHGRCLVMHKEGNICVDLDKPIGENAVENLDVYQAEKQILEPILGVVDSSSDERMSFLRGDTLIEDLREQLTNESIQLALILAPCTLDEVKKVGDQGLIMPPKSTWIEPKMQTGMITQLF